MRAEHADWSAAADAGPWLSSALSGPATVRSRMRTRAAGRRLPGNGRMSRPSMGLTKCPQRRHHHQFHMGCYIRPADVWADLSVPSSPDGRPTRRNPARPGRDIHEFHHAYPGSPGAAPGRQVSSYRRIALSHNHVFAHAHTDRERGSPHVSGTRGLRHD